jgi:hypothetical protein
VHTRSLSQRSLHIAPIFRLLLKVAVNGTQQCDFQNFCGALGPQRYCKISKSHFQCHRRCEPAPPTSKSDRYNFLSSTRMFVTSLRVRVRIAMCRCVAVCVAMCMCVCVAVRVCAYCNVYVCCGVCCSVCVCVLQCVCVCVLLCVCFALCVCVLQCVSCSCC